MDLFESRKTKFLRTLGTLLPLAFAVVLCTAFLLFMNQTSSETIAREQETLTQALEKGAVHSYALTGRYPESLRALTEAYRITYDPDKFVVEYIPNGSNLMPSIQVIPRPEKKGAMQ